MNHTTIIKEAVIDNYNKLKSGVVNCTDFEKQELLERYEYFLMQFDEWCAIADEVHDEKE
jgi:hypothetical protein